MRRLCVAEVPGLEELRKLVEDIRSVPQVYLVVNPIVPEDYWFEAQEGLYKFRSGRRTGRMIFCSKQSFLDYMDIPFEAMPESFVYDLNAGAVIDIADLQLILGRSLPRSTGTRRLDHVG